jgi:hypothetical protein
MRLHFAGFFGVAILLSRLWTITGTCETDLDCELNGVCVEVSVTVRCAGRYTSDNTCLT